LSPSYFDSGKTLAVSTDFTKNNKMLHVIAKLYKTSNVTFDQDINAQLEKNFLIIFINLQTTIVTLELKIT
jgi:hypothetical protein